MSHRGSDVFPEEIAVSDTSAVDGAVVCPQSRLDDDHRLLKLIDAWPMLSDDIRDAIARLAGSGADANQQLSSAPG